MEPNWGEIFKMTGACKDLKERILNSEEYKSKQKKKEDDFNREQKIDNMRKEILGWFIGLPLGRYKIYGEKYLEDHHYGPFNLLTKKIEKQKSWIVSLYQGPRVEFINDFYHDQPDEDETEWIYNNQEQVCKEGIKYLG